MTDQIHIDGKTYKEVEVSYPQCSPMMKSVYLAIRFHYWQEPHQTWGRRQEYALEPVSDRVLHMYNINSSENTWMHVCHPYLIHKNIRYFQNNKDQKKKRHTNLKVYYPVDDPGNRGKYRMTVDGQLCDNFFREMQYKINYMTAKNSMKDSAVCGKCRKTTPKSARAKLFLLKVGGGGDD